jgi:YfaZ precursor
MQRTASLSKAFAAVVLGFAVGGTANAAEQSIDLGLSDHVFTAGYGYELRPDVSAQVGFLHSNSNDRHSNLLDAGFGVAGSLTPIVKARIGAKVFALNSSHVDGHGLAADAGVTINVAPKVFLDVSAAYAPDIVTGGDVDRYYDLGIKAGYEIIPKAMVYVGYRDAQGVLNGPDYEIYEGFVVGYHMSF